LLSLIDCLGVSGFPGARLVALRQSDINSDDSESPYSDSDSIYNIYDNDIRDTDTNSDLYASDIDAAEEKIVATVLLSAEEMTNRDNE